MRTFRIIAYILLISILLTMVITVVQVASLRLYNPENTAWMRMRVRNAKAAGKTLKIKQSWIPLSEIPRFAQQAVMAAEDDGFYQHNGFDWDAMKKAYELNEKKERIKRGGSTITQQLAKNLYLSPSRTYIRKGREAIITALLELLLPKNRIFEIYLNVIEFGPGVFGIEEGARYHFGLSARQLSLEQACRLASIIPAPLRYKVNGPYINKRASNLIRIVGGPGAGEPGQ